MKKDDYVDYLLNKLINSGYRVDVKLAQDFLSIKERTIEPLIKLVKIDQYWFSRDEKKNIAPLTALHLLSLTRDKSAFDAIVYAIYNYGEVFGDWVSEIANLLSNFGEEFYEEISSMLFDDRLRYWIKEPIAIALVIIAKSDTKNTNGDLLKSTINLFKNIITKEKDRETKSILAGVLADLKDPSLMDFIKSLFDNHEIDEEIISYSKVQEIYKGEYDEYIDIIYARHSPLEYFKANELFFFPKGNEELLQQQLESYTFVEDVDKHCDDLNDDSIISTSFSSASITPLTKYNTKVLVDKYDNNSDNANPSHVVIKTKTGRNDPCPCDSGKKYKKCCMVL